MFSSAHFDEGMEFLQNSIWLTVIGTGELMSHAKLLCNSSKQVILKFFTIVCYQGERTAKRGIDMLELCLDDCIC